MAEVIEISLEDYLERANPTIVPIFDSVTEDNLVFIGTVAPTSCGVAFNFTEIPSIKLQINDKVRFTKDNTYCESEIVFSSPEDNGRFCMVLANPYVTHGGNLLNDCKVYLIKKETKEEQWEFVAPIDYANGSGFFCHSNHDVKVASLVKLGTNFKLVKKDGTEVIGKITKIDGAYPSNVYHSDNPNLGKLNNSLFVKDIDLYILKER